MNQQNPSHRENNPKYIIVRRYDIEQFWHSSGNRGWIRDRNKASIFNSFESAYAEFWSGHLDGRILKLK